MQPIPRTNQQPHGPDERSEAEERPDREWLRAMSREQPVERIHLQQARTEGTPPVGGTELKPVQLLPSLHLPRRKGFVLPGARDDERCGNEQPPTENVGEEDGRMEVIERGLSERSLESHHRRVARAGDQEVFRDRTRRTPLVTESGEKRKARCKEQHDEERDDHGATFVPADGGTKHPRGKREEERVHRHQDDAPELGEGHAAEQQRNRHDGKDGEDAVEGVQRCRNQFAEHDVVALEVREEQQAERSLALLFAQTICGAKHPDEQAVEVNGAGGRNEHGLPQLPRTLAAHDQHHPSADEHADSRHRQADPIRPAPPRGFDQFAFNNGEEGHATGFISPLFLDQNLGRRNTPLCSPDACAAISRI